MVCILHTSYRDAKPACAGSVRGQVEQDRQRCVEGFRQYFRDNIHFSTSGFFDGAPSSEQDRAAMPAATPTTSSGERRRGSTSGEVLPAHHAERTVGAQREGVVFDELRAWAFDRRLAALQVVDDPACLVALQP